MLNIKIPLGLLCKFLLHINKGERISIYKSLIDGNKLQIASNNKMCTYNLQQNEIVFVTDAWGIMIKLYMQDPETFIDFQTKYQG